MGRRQAAGPSDQELLWHRCIARVFSPRFATGGAVAVAVLAAILVAGLLFGSRSVAAAGDGGGSTSLDTLAHCLSCRDRATPDGFSCSQQEKWGKCQESWLVAGDFCSLTCGRCCLAMASSGPGKQKTPAHPPAHGKYDANMDSSGDMIVVLHGAGKSKDAKSPAAAAASIPQPGPTAQPVPESKTERMLQFNDAKNSNSNKSDGPAPARSNHSNSSSPGQKLPAADPDVDKQYACDGHITIHQVLTTQAEALHLSQFVEALHWAGLENSFDQPNAQATVLIPIDSAWQHLATDLDTTVPDLLSNTTALRAIMLYHLVPQSLSPSALQRTPVIPTYWKGHDLYGTFSSNSLMLGTGSGRTAHILQKLQVCHSFLYTLDRVLLPTTEQLSSLPQLTEYNPNDHSNQASTCTAAPTALAALKADADLSTTASVLALLGLAGKLGSATSNLTLLAPVNAAWDSFAMGLDTTTSALLSNASAKSTLESIATFHLVPQSLSCGQGLCEGSYSTLNRRGGPLYVHNLRSNRSSVQSLTSTAIVIPPTSACSSSGNLVKIDAVLQPGPSFGATDTN